MVPSAQRSHWQREGGRVGQGGRAGRQLQTYPTIAHQPQVGDFGEEVGGGTPVGGRPDL